MDNGSLYTAASFGTLASEPGFEIFAGTRCFCIPGTDDFRFRFIVVIPAVVRTLLVELFGTVRG